MQRGREGASGRERNHELGAEGSKNLLPGTRRWHTVPLLFLIPTLVGDSGGKLPRGFKVGGRKVWRISDLQRWCEWGFPDRARFELKLKIFEKSSDSTCEMNRNAL